MSTITVTNIKATGETASRPVSGVAGAWIALVASTATAKDSLNISSVTDNGTGTFTFSFSSAMANDDYAITCNGSEQVFSYI